VTILILAAQKTTPLHFSFILLFFKGIAPYIVNQYSSLLPLVLFFTQKAHIFSSCQNHLYSIA
jgi:hypothetical protein